MTWILIAVVVYLLLGAVTALMTWYETPLAERKAALANSRRQVAVTMVVTALMFPYVWLKFLRGRRRENRALAYQGRHWG